MSETASTIIKIKQIYPGLKGNNRRIADQVLNSPELLMSKKVSDIAKACDCDAAQVIRFCQRLGFKGFTELKTHLAQELIPLHSEKNYEKMKGSDVFDQLRSDYFRNITQTMSDTIMHLDKSSLLKSVKAIHDASRIVICGSGASNLTAQDLHIKLLRMGFVSFCFPDQEMQRISCSLQGKSDLLIVFSFSGNSEAMIRCMETAKANSGKILLITNYQESKAAKLADLMLHTAADEEKLRIGAMASRIAQLAVIDLLVSFLTLKYPDQINRNILKTHQAIH